LRQALSTSLIYASQRVNNYWQDLFKKW